MYGLYGPNPITTFISTAIFYIVIGVMLAGGGYVYYLTGRIESLKISLGECESATSAYERKEGFLQDNLAILKRHCSRKSKPVVMEGKFNVENLFNADPR